MEQNKLMRLKDILIIITHAYELEYHDRNFLALDVHAQIVEFIKEAQTIVSEILTGSPLVQAINDGSLFIVDKDEISNAIRANHNRRL